MKTFSKLLAGTAIAALGMGAFVLKNSESRAADPCKRTSFQTKLVADACKAGGQDEAKKQMKAFLKKVQAKKEDATCLTCHTDLAPNYPLKGDALKLFKEYGGT